MIVTFVDGSVEQYEDVPFTQGSMGAIFLSHDRKSVIKLYHPNPRRDSEHIKRLDIIINELNPAKDDPYWKEFFTWPEKRVVKPAVGYRMRLVSGLKTLSHYIFAKAYSRLKPEEKGWFIGEVAVAIKLVSAADRLARMGICYANYSDKNVMVEPFEGRMVLIDCDDIIVPGKVSATVEGTTWYRAPEIVMGDVKIPSIETDRHALAVLLFLWFLRCHPLRGDKEIDPDPDRDDQLHLGEKALYIEHPIDLTNRNSKQVLKAAILGPELEKLFRTAFVDGLHHPHLRPTPNEWQQALYHMYDQIIPCASEHCNWHFFVATPAPRLTCPMCKQPLRTPQTLPFVYLIQHRGLANLDQYIDKANAHYIVGWPGRLLYQWHLGSDNPLNASDTNPCAVFEYDQYTRRWYLKNLTLSDTLYTTPKDQVMYGGLGLLLRLFLSILERLSISATF